jgi:transcriptional regulator with XRE-family HTH domain
MDTTTAVQSPGQLLRELRESLHLSLRDVERASYTVAEHFKNQEFILVLSRLSDIESKGVTPSIHRLCSLAFIYGLPIERMLAFYGIDFQREARGLIGKLPIAGTHNDETGIISSNTPATIEIPYFEQGFHLRETSLIKRFIEEWGTVPISHVRHLAGEDFLYAHIGDDDRMMYPLLRPGAFVQVDQRLRRVKASGWTNDYDRPIYFVETREGYACCWCSQPRKDQLILQPHSHSPVSPRVLRHPEDAEVIGTVVGIAMRLGTNA